MKCLLCSKEPTNSNDLMEHYVTLIELTLTIGFSKNLGTLEEKKIHDFIRYYEDGQIKPFELKPMDMEQYGLITKYAISA